MPSPDEISETLLEEWRDDQVWFREFLPKDYPWGDERFLDEVASSERGKYGIQFGTSGRLGKEKYEKGQLTLTDDREVFETLFASAKNFSGIVVPWFDRIVPAGLMLPYEKPIDGAGYRKELRARFLKALGIGIVLISLGLWFREFFFLALLVTSFYCVFPVVEVALLYFRKVENLPVPELNRRAVNLEFFQRWISLQPTAFVKMALAVLVVIFLGQVVADLPVFLNRVPFDPSGLPSIQAAALIQSNVLEGGEWWRLVSAGLVHAAGPFGIIHIAFNGMALFGLGRIITALASFHMLTIVFLVSLVAGSLASLYLPPDLPSVGASGGILGCLAFLLVITFKFQGVIPGFYRFRLIQSVIVVAVVGLLGYRVFDNAAHAGGVLGGLILGLCIYPRLALVPKSTPTAIRVLGWTSLAVLGTVAIKVGVELVEAAIPGWS